MKKTLFIYADLRWLDLIRAKIKKESNRVIYSEKSHKVDKIELQSGGKPMGLTEKAIDYLEEHIPELAEVAFKQAYWAALASGSSVLVSENGGLIEVFPDGRRKFIKKLPSWTPVKRGQKLEIK